MFKLIAIPAILGIVLAPCAFAQDEGPAPSVADPAAQPKAEVVPLEAPAPATSAQSGQPAGTAPTVTEQPKPAVSADVDEIEADEIRHRTRLRELAREAEKTDLEAKIEKNKAEVEKAKREARGETLAPNSSISFPPTPSAPGAPSMAGAEISFGPAPLRLIATAGDLAVIAVDGQSSQYRVGDTVDGRRLQSIHFDEVVLTDSRGRRKTLKLGW